MSKRIAPSKFPLLLVLGLLPAPLSNALSSIRSSVFVGQNVNACSNAKPLAHCFRRTRTAVIEMRKQKASDRRTRRRQRGKDLEETFDSLTTLTTSPMRGNSWAQRPAVRMPKAQQVTGGRQRSRKRSTLYNSLSFYHNTFLNQLTAEYQAEEEEVIGRIKASMDDPLGLETSGFALFDMYAERRGNLFGDAIFRLTKAHDATTIYPRNNIEDDNSGDTIHTNQSETDTSTMATRYLPPNHKFSTNDVIMLTLQRAGSGDFFSSDSMPIGETAITAEARVLNMGPTYLDIVLPEGSFEGAFGPAPNDRVVMLDEAKKNFNLRLRVDRFFSNVPYQRMVSALAALTTIPDRSSNKPKAALQDGDKKDEESDRPAHSNICMDELLREVIISTYAVANPNSPLLGDRDACDIQELANRLAKPPMASSSKLANQVLKYFQSNTHGIFCDFNAPQLAAIEAALTRRMTMIQGPPGTGKTTVSSAIALGFVHQCRSLSPHTKVLACAFSNVGADNLAEAIAKVGLKIVRIGRPSAVMESLWDKTLEAAIDRDPEAQKALKRAAKATSQLAACRQKKGSTTNVSERSLREMATAAVKASIHACNLAATAALREADVIVTTSTGAADARLLAACGIVTKDDDDNESSSKAYGKGPEKSNIALRQTAPDGLPPLSLPFVIVDEACQSIEPATLIPILSSNSCRSLVLLGDPCQLPPTVKSREAPCLSVSLMERLAALLPHPVVSTQPDTTVKDTSYLDALPVKQANSLLRSRGESGGQASYRKRFSGSLLLSLQYRMHPSIAALPSAIFYDGLLSTPDFMASQRPFPSFWKKAMPSADQELGVRLINVGGRSNERQGMPSRFTHTVFGSSVRSFALEDQTTYWNEAEAERVVSLIKDVLLDVNREVSSIGVVTPYNGQVQLIKSMIANEGNLRKVMAANPVTIEVKSVDGYQGRERDVIIFSAVRSNRQARIGFLHDWRRLNVALTRAKNAIVVVGDLDTLAEADKHWDALVRWASGVRCILDDFDAIDDEPSH